jgi:hypothetical protein
MDYVVPTTIQDEVIAFLLSAPTPAQERLRYLLDANRSSLTPDERGELEEASHLNHFIILLKAKARKA